MIKQIAAIAVVLVTAGYASAATQKASYELKRIPMGPRPDQYVLVRVDRAPQAEQPYALTGDAQPARVERNKPRYTPLHATGTHGPF